MTENLIEYVDRAVGLWIPLAASTLNFFLGLVVIVDLLSEAVKLSQPRASHNFTTHCCPECVFTKLEVFLLVTESSNSSLYCIEEVVSVVG